MVIITEMRELAEAMDAEGQPQPHALYKLPNGQWAADVFPLGLEGILYGGFKGELWMEPGKEPTQVCKPTALCSVVRLVHCTQNTTEA